MKATLGIAVVLALLVVMTGCAQTQPIVVQGDESTLRNTISVQGVAKLDVDPDLAEVVLSVTSIQKTAQEAQAENAQKSTAVIAALKNAGLTDKDIETTSVQLYPRYEWNEVTKRSVIDGYEARHTITVTTKNIDDAGNFADVAVQAGASELQGISFTLSKEKEASVRKEALSQAMTDAREKARVLGEAAGVTVGKPVSVSESFGWSPGPFYYDRMAMSSEAAASPVMPGAVEFSGTVSVSYSIS